MRISNCEFRLIQRCNSAFQFERNFLEKIACLHPAVDEMEITPYWKENGSFEGWCRFSTEQLITIKSIELIFLEFNSYKTTEFENEYEFFSARTLSDDQNDLLCEMHIPKIGFTEVI